MQIYKIFDLACYRNDIEKTVSSFQMLYSYTHISVHKHTSKCGRTTSSNNAIQSNLVYFLHLSYEYLSSIKGSKVSFFQYIKIQLEFKQLLKFTYLNYIHIIKHKYFNYLQLLNFSWYLRKQLTKELKITA